jgi:sugar transferase (PEP-CTERM/EpsH1 system associated)
MMRVLFVVPSLPFPPTSGLAIRMYQFVRLLARRHEVSILGFGNADTAAFDALSQLGVSVYAVPDTPVGWHARRFAQLASVWSRSSFYGRVLRSAALQDRLDALCDQTHFDLIQVETSQLAATLRFKRGWRVVLDEHDIVYELLDSMARAEHSPLRRLYNRLEHRRFMSEEVAIWGRVSAVVTTSRREARIIGAAAPDTPVLAAGNGVDVDYFRPSDGPVAPARLVMTGFMKTRPNADAATFFAREVLPLVSAVRPDVTFYVVGGEPPADVRRLAASNVVVTGGVADVRPYLREAAAVVVPIRMGGGTRLKILEALAMRKPVVSTTLGCEGLDVVNGEHLIVADEPAPFAEAVLRLLSDRTLANRLAARGYALARRSYMWEPIVDELERFWKTLVQ